MLVAVVICGTPATFSIGYSAAIEGSIWVKAVDFGKEVHDEVDVA